MDETQFRELYESIHGKKEVDWQARLNECQEIVKELWQIEFKDEIKGKRIVVRIVPEDEMDSLASVAESISIPGKFIIRVNMRLWNSTQVARLKKILAHEMLHIATGLGHKDPEWEVEAQRRKVWPWDNIWGY